MNKADARKPLAGENLAGKICFCALGTLGVVKEKKSDGTWIGRRVFDTARRWESKQPRVVAESIDNFAVAFAEMLRQAIR